MGRIWNWKAPATVLGNTPSWLWIREGLSLGRRRGSIGLSMCQIRTKCVHTCGGVCMCVYTSIQDALSMFCNMVVWNSDSVERNLGGSNGGRLGNYKCLKVMQLCQFSHSVQLNPTSCWVFCSIQTSTTHARTHTHTHASAHTHTHTDPHRCTDTCTHMCKCTHTCTRTHTHTHKSSHMH